MKVVVIGGGVAGVSAALDLARQGHEVVVAERSERIGGLVASFEIGGTPLECFYHHVFPHESEIQQLIAELGLASKLEWHPSTVGVFTGGRLWPFTSPVDLLRFKPLPFTERLRTGVGALRLGRVAHWEQLDELPAREWLESYTGAKAAEVVWDPLLGAKFGPAAAEVPAAWMWGRFQQRAGARKGGGEKLGYLRGGFRQLFDAAAAELERLGADVRTATGVGRIVVDDDGRATGIETDHGTVEADHVLFTGPLPVLSRLVDDRHVDARWDGIGALGVLCTVLELRRPVSPIYWTNVCDPDVPFGGVIEHTNLIPASDYGTHVMYLSRYFTHDEAIASADPMEESMRWIGVLDERYPGFSKDDVTAVHPFTTPFAAPLVRVGHRRRIPPLESHVAGLWVCTTAQIYPQDRGMSEGVRTGKEAAAAIAASGVRAESIGRGA
jgi:protoporphyrinogen oxidase